MKVVLVSRQIGFVGQRHHLYPTGYHQIVLTRRDAVGPELGGHQARTAEVVHGCTATLQPPGVERCHARNITTLAP